MSDGLNPKQKMFAREYIIDMNATQAAIRAGYSEKTAYSQGQRLLKNVEVQAEIQKCMQKRAERTDITADDVLKRWAELAQADPNELTSVIVGSCRFCHGNGHQYQWRDEVEFGDAQEAYFAMTDRQREKEKAPVMGGGYGYKWRKEPNIDCPRCDGLGFARTVIRDTTELSAAGRALFAGVKETQHGVEIKMHDQMGALLNVAKHLGMFPTKVEMTGKDGAPIQTEDRSMTEIARSLAFVFASGVNEQEKDDG